MGQLAAVPHQIAMWSLSQRRLFEFACGEGAVKAEGVAEGQELLPRRKPVLNAAPVMMRRALLPLKNHQRSLPQ